MLQGGHNRRKSCVEGVRRIDIREMQTLGTLKTPGRAFFTTQWRMGGEHNGSVGLEYWGGNDYVTAVYTLTDLDTGDVQDKKQTIRLEFIQTNYGKRAYFKCFLCRKRTATLYFHWAVFKCRKCANLNYRSSQSNSRDYTERYRRKAEHVLKKLKYAPGWSYDLYYVPKPARMRFNTYYDLLKRLRKYQELRMLSFGYVVEARFGKNYY